MLRQRVITALIMAGIFLSAIVFLPLPALAAVFGLLVTAGGWEWSRLAGWQSPVTRGLYMLLLAACMAALYWYCQLGNAPVREQVQPFLGLACLWWSFALGVADPGAGLAGRGIPAQFPPGRVAGGYHGGGGRSGGYRRVFFW
jgi:CDP-diglyceride synthetase